MKDAIPVDVFMSFASCKDINPLGFGLQILPQILSLLIAKPNYNV
jgi:hypothetical protein